MNVLIDLNVLLDVFQKREPYYRSSALTRSKSLEGFCVAVIPAHALTTLHYLISKNSGVDKANDVIDIMLLSFTVAPISQKTFQRARELNAIDFEDSVVMAVAEEMNCHYIVTRNSRDFLKSTIRALSPSEFLLQLALSERS
ncbi:MAG: type II toxin-antitoxin system VapC family toxin [Chloroherpetonaceae bacterium]